MSKSVDEFFSDCPVEASHLADKVGKFVAEQKTHTGQSQRIKAGQSDQAFHIGSAFTFSSLTTPAVVSHDARSTVLDLHLHDASHQAAASNWCKL